MLDGRYAARTAARGDRAAELVLLGFILHVKQNVQLVRAQRMAENPTDKKGKKSN